MQVLDLAIDILTDITTNDTPFNEALKKKFQTDPSIRGFRKDVAGLVGCELRHGLLFERLLEGFALNQEEFYAAALLLANAYFYKHTDIEELKAAVKEKIPEESYEKLLPFLDKGGPTPSYIPEDVKNGSMEYLSLRYNTPIWVLKAWKNFGYGNVFRTLKKNIRPATPSVRVRTSALKCEDVEANPDFVKTPVEAIYSYTGKEPIRKMDWFAKGLLFNEKAGIKSILDQYKVSEPSEVFVYSDNSSIHKEVIESYGASIGLNLGCGNGVENHVDVVKLIKAKDLRNVNFFSAQADSLEASISRPQDLVVVLPPSTEFDSIRENPDFFVHLKTEQLDEIIAKQKAILEGIDPYVAEDGTLIYMVLTMNKKESRFLVGDFLRTHENYKLEKEEQIFPFNALDTTIYFAVLKKESKLAKATPPLGELESAVSIANGLSASSAEE